MYEWKWIVILHSGVKRENSTTKRKSYRLLHSEREQENSTSGKVILHSGIDEENSTAKRKS
jgi:hypothetical protein